MAKIERIKTDVLHLAYEDSGPKNGEPVLLLHGWPDSPRTWDSVLPMLHHAGYRTVVPYQRGFAPTEFRSHLLARNPRHTGQPVAMAQDMVDLADDLGWKSFHFVGHDWGARAGYALSALFPQRLRSLTAISVPFQPGPAQPPENLQAHAYWYQWFLCTKPGAQRFIADPVAFARKQWETWSPEGWFREEEFAATAKSWRTKEFAEVTLHSYRVRWGHAPIDPKYDVLQDRYDATPSLPTPTVLLHGFEDRCTLPETTDGAGRFFTGGYRRVLIEDAGHFVPREAPEAVAAEVIRHIEGQAR